MLERGDRGWRISVARLSKVFGATRAVDDVSFSVEAGNLLVLLGPSGCGKSTTLRLLAGLDRADGGVIRFGERDVTDLAPAKRDVAMVFQSYALFPHLTVRRNITFGLHVRKLSKAEIAARLARAAEVLGLGELLDRKPAQLSGGQRQRVALGRAMVSEAPICLMDEPLSNLDARLRQDMRAEIRALQQRLGVTMVYVTHDQVEAMTMADRIILMRAGRIEQDASPEEIYGAPATAFAAEFIGTPPMNLLNLADAGLAAALGRSPGEILVGVRPEHMAIVTEGGVPATVEACEYLGSDVIVACRIGEQRASARIAGGMRLPTGLAVRLAWAADKAHLFDRKTGRRATP